MDKRGDGGARGQISGGKARFLDPYASRGTPDAVNSGPPSQRGPHSPPLSTLRNHSETVWRQREAALVKKKEIVKKKEMVKREGC